MTETSSGRVSGMTWHAVDTLLLDPENPRLVTGGRVSQDDLLKQLYEQEALDELARSLVDNGYFAEEPLVIVAAPTAGEWIVVEGNRRLATLKLLLDSSKRQRVRVSGWPRLTEEQQSNLSEVPCVEYEDRARVLPFLGFRHITGAKKWAPFQKARFIAQLVNEGHKLTDVEDLIGDTSHTVRKLYQDYVVYDQIVNELNLPEQPIRSRFSLLEVTLGQRPIKQYLGMTNRLPLEPVEALVPEEKLDSLEEVVGWVFGTDSRRPLVNESRDITRLLAPVLQNEASTEYLKSSNDLEMAYEYSGGEKDYLLKKLNAAERSLREASSIAAVYQSDHQVQEGIKRIQLLVEGLTKVSGA